MKKRKKERRGNTTQRRKLKQQLEMTKTEIQTYVQSEEGSSEDPLYEPSRKEFKRADKVGDN